MAPISGSIDSADASPLAAAWREINEETTLTPLSLTLLRQGKSYSFCDESVGREWTIYPFAFILKPSEKGREGIVIDWEHEGWDWYDPLRVEDSEEFGGVPRLAESLRRVWFEKDLGLSAGRELSTGLERLRNDHQSGARELASIALQILREVVSALSLPESRDDWWAKIRFAAWHLWKNGRESMGAAILNVLLSALGSIEDALSNLTSDSTEPKELRDAVLGALGRHIASRDKVASKPVSDAFAKYVEAAFPSRRESQEPVSVLTLSESSTIAHSLRHLVFESGFSLDLRILESRPLFEGVSLAASILRDSTPPTAPSQEAQAKGGQAPPKIKISLFSDASAALAADGVDIVVIGADRIAGTGAVSNKTGSLPAILSARHVAAAKGSPIKIIVLGESEKIAPPGNTEEHVVEDNDPEQIRRSWTADYNSTRVRQGSHIIRDIQEKLRGHDGVEITVHNIFFEWCPPKLIDVYLTEFGQWTAEDISKYSERLGTEEDRLFGDL